jgi:predicted amidophosphoribosyltransferase
MATVSELSEPYRNHLISVLPPGRGVCAVCWTAVPSDFRLCFQCNQARNEFGRRLANVVVPIALAVKREQLAHELWHYKYDVDPSVRSRLTTRLGAVLWRFLGQHEKHIAEAIGMSTFSIVTTVPGTRQRDGNHPLEDIVGALVGHTKARYEPLLSIGHNEAPLHSLAADRYLATRQLRGEPAVLLIDDTWTTGGNAQSAALALRAAGAAKIAIVVMGRHFDRGFRDCETYYQQAKSIRFTWDSCCLELSAALVVLRRETPSVNRPRPSCSSRFLSRHCSGVTPLRWARGYALAQRGLSERTEGDRAAVA